MKHLNNSTLKTERIIDRTVIKLLKRFPSLVTKIIYSMGKKSKSKYLFGFVASVSYVDHLLSIFCFDSLTSQLISHIDVIKCGVRQRYTQPLWIIIPPAHAEGTPLITAQPGNTLWYDWLKQGHCLKRLCCNSQQQLVAAAVRMLHILLYDRGTGVTAGKDLMSGLGVLSPGKITTLMITWIQRKLLQKKATL